MTTLASTGLSGGEVAGLIVAVFWAILVCFIAFVLVKLAGVVGEAGRLVGQVTDHTVPLLDEVTSSVEHVNAELERVDAITSNVQNVSANVSAMTALVAATFGSPVIKVAAFSYGVRRALTEQREPDLRKRLTTEARFAARQRRGARHASRGGDA
jgi:uncharacterized protein YoxC